MIEEKLYSNKKKLRSHLNYIFEDFDFSGKDILDVGGGAGLLSFYGGFCRNSICLEPELEGSSPILRTNSTGFGQKSLSFPQGRISRYELSGFSRTKEV